MTQTLPLAFKTQTMRKRKLLTYNAAIVINVYTGVSVHGCVRVPACVWLVCERFIGGYYSIQVTVHTTV